MQAYFTGLGNDEAYYWTWSQFLDWGYFHHPPMVALVIRIGWIFFHGEFGVRVVGVLFSTCSLIGIFQLTDKKNSVLFSAIASSILLVQISGFFIAPDIPLLFFTVLFFHVVKKYLANDNWKNGLTLSVMVACMFYSKYHAIFPVVFTIIACPELLKRKSFYFISIFAAALFLPHLFWQIQNHFPTFQFHIHDRSKVGFDISNITDYLLGQIILIGPFATPLILFAAFKYKSQNKFERILKFNAAGILLLIFALSFRSHTESNRTAEAFPSFAILSYQFLSDKIRLKKWIYGISFFSIVIFMLMRIHLVCQMVNIKNDPTQQFHGWKKFTTKVEQLANGNFIAANGHHIPSQIWFYSGKKVSSFNFGGNKNQYDLWKFDKEINGKHVLLLQGSRFDSPYDSLELSNGRNIFLKLIDTFPLLKYLKITIEKSPKEFIHSSIVSFDLKIDCGGDSFFVTNKTLMSYHIFKNNKMFCWDGMRTSFGKTILKNSFHLSVPVKLPDEPGEYEIEFTPLNETFGWWKNDCRTKIIVK